MDKDAERGISTAVKQFNSNAPGDLALSLASAVPLKKTRKPLNLKTGSWKYIIYTFQRSIVSSPKPKQSGGDAEVRARGN